MNDPIFYDVFLNKEKIATVGPNLLKQLHISFGVSDGKAIVKAGGISDDEPGLLFINWLEKNVEFGDSFSVSPSQENVATTPRHTKKLNREWMILLRMTRCVIFVIVQKMRWAN